MRTERVSTAALITCYDDDNVGRVLATLVDKNVYRVLVLSRKTKTLVVWHCFCASFMHHILCRAS